MGIAFSIDTPIKVAPKGIDSVISIIDDVLIEEVRKVYSERYRMPYEAIDDADPDASARRITAYLDLVKQIVGTQIARFRQECTLMQAVEYFDLLPDTSPVKRGFVALMKNGSSEQHLLDYARSQAALGSIDVNIMTKLDTGNYRKGQLLPRIYSRAHAALRGYANSSLTSSLVLSAGLNPELYGYIATFDDFFPDKEGKIKKKITLKVSDYRSALIQGKFLAKKGLWVSEFRIESGLNCGGHAFATEGHLMGPILEAFKNDRKTLRQTMYDLLSGALAQQNRPVPAEAPRVKVTAQGGVGTPEEHRFLLDYYGLDAVGWGTPFLLVPEVTCVDRQTREQLRQAKEADLYLSNISPLGVPFHNLRGNSKDVEKERLAEIGKPGSPCVKKALAFNTEYTKKPICTASRKYQNIKLKQLQDSQMNEGAYKNAYAQITEKACICTGLGTPFLLENGLSTRKVGASVSVCPGPNLAYFDKLVSLREMVDHIYGRISIMDRTDRPHMFEKELRLYFDHLESIIGELSLDNTAKAQKRIQAYIANLQEGIGYYRHLFATHLRLPAVQATSFSALLAHVQHRIDEVLLTLAT